MKIDEFLPKFDYSEVHERRIRASCSFLYERLAQIDFSKSKSLAFLFWLRGLKTKSFSKLEEKFVLLYKEKPYLMRRKASSFRAKI